MRAISAVIASMNVRAAPMTLDPTRGLRYMRRERLETRPPEIRSMPASPFRLYSTLTRDVRPFEPVQPEHIGLYVCGMTVYDRCHVGHARAMMVFDTFVRWLRWKE